MTLYARSVSGIVAEIFTPPDGEAIADCFTPELVAQFVAVPDGLAVVPGWTYDGTTFAPPAPPTPPTVQEQAQALLGQPVTVVSTSLPDALNGIYPIDVATQVQINTIAGAINAGLGLPGGGVTFNWADTSGAMHPWPATQFTAFAKEVMNYGYALSQVAQGHGDTLPSSTLTVP
jgi:hypothetical protein